MNKRKMSAQGAKTKKYFKQVICAVVLTFIGLSFSPTSASAVDWFGQVDSNGNLSAGVGSTGSLSNNSGFMLNNQFGLPSGSILGIATNLLFWLLAIFAILGVVGFVLSGIFYLLAGADESNAEKGKTGMTASIIGIIVGLSGFLIIQAVNLLLGGASKTF